MAHFELISNGYKYTMEHDVPKFSWGDSGMLRFLNATTAGSYRSFLDRLSFRSIGANGIYILDLDFSDERSCAVVYQLPPDSNDFTKANIQESHDGLLDPDEDRVFLEILHAFRELANQLKLTKVVIEVFP